MNANDFIGFSTQEALEYCRAHSIDCRIASVDGRSRILTDDIQRDRLNFTIQDDKVISVRKG
jgi:hypothetical protein